MCARKKNDILLNEVKVKLANLGALEGKWPQGLSSAKIF